MSGYTFKSNQLVAIIRDARVEGFHRVESQKHGIVTLKNGTKWYAASGLPIRGSADRRLTTVNPSIEKQSERKGQAMRLVELASIIADNLDSPMRATEGELYRAERALWCVAKSLRPMGVPKNCFARDIEQRLDEAEKGALEHLRQHG